VGSAGGVACWQAAASRMETNIRDLFILLCSRLLYRFYGWPDTPSIDIRDGLLRLTGAQHPVQTFIKKNRMMMCL
jgi:hypothetical protein